MNAAKQANANALKKKTVDVVLDQPVNVESTVNVHHKIIVDVNNLKNHVVTVVSQENALVLQKRIVENVLEVSVTNAIQNVQQQNSVSVEMTVNVLLNKIADVKLK